MTFKLSAEARQHALNLKEKAINQVETAGGVLGPEKVKFSPKKTYIVPLPTPQGNLWIGVGTHFGVDRVMGAEVGDGFYPPCPRNTLLQLPQSEQPLGSCPICDLYFDAHRAYKEAQLLKDVAKADYYAKMKQALYARPKYWFYAAVFTAEEKAEKGKNLVLTKDHVRRVEAPQTIYRFVKDTWFKPLQSIFEDSYDLLAAKGVDVEKSPFDLMVDTGTGMVASIILPEDKRYVYGWEIGLQVTLAEDILEGLPELTEIYHALPTSSTDFTNPAALKQVAESFEERHRTLLSGTGPVTSGTPDPNPPTSTTSSGGGILGEAIKQQQTPVVEGEPPFFDSSADEDDEDSEDDDMTL